MWNWRAVAIGVLLALPATAAVAQSLPEARLVTQLGHHDLVSSVAFSPSGETVLTSSWDKTARLWETSSGKELRTFVGHSDTIWSVVFSPDGRSVLTTSLDQTVRLWNAASGKELQRFGETGGFSAAFSPGGRVVVTGGFVVRLWDVSSGKEVRRFGGNNERIIAAVAFSPDGRTVLTGSSDNTARLWDADSGKELRSFAGHTDSVVAVAFSPDGRTVLTGSNDNTARLWDAESGMELSRLSGNAGHVSSVAFSPDGRFVLTAGLGDAARLWEVSSGREIREFGSNTCSTAFSPDGRTVLTGSHDGTAQMWDVSSGKELQRFEGHSIDVMSVAASHDGSRLLMGGRNETAQMWDTASGKELLRLIGHTGVVTAVAFSPEDRTALTGSGDGTARLWDTESGKELKQFQGRYGFDAVAFWVTGEYVLAGNMDGTARMWEVKSGGGVQEFDAGSPGGEASNWVDAVAFTPDGQYVLTGSWDGMARLWDPLSGKEIRRFSGHTGHVTSAAFSSDGRTLLTGSNDKTARLWDVASGRELQKFVGHGDVVSSVAFSADGRSVLTGSWDMTARLWDVATGKELRRFEGHTNSIQSVAFVPDGKHLLTGSLDGTSRLWDTTTGQEVASLVSFSNGGWAVVDKEGRFDTNDLDGVAPLQWVVSDAPFHALPLEIFMRDYYTPGLLARVMKGEKLPEVRSIAEIKNRAQPEVEVVSVAASAKTQGRVDVTVHAASVTNEKGTKSGLQDLRLFRDGQMVADGYREGELKDGDFVFRDAMLKSDAKKVTFTAYAFSGERIKSATASMDYEVKTPSAVVKRRAFLLQVGVNYTAAKGCELKYSVNDAETMSEALSARLQAQGFEVEAVKLESGGAGEIVHPTHDDKTVMNGPPEYPASKDAIRAQLREIAAKATPDDVFFMSFSGHGYSAAGGAFYILPSDVEGSCSDAAQLKNMISADELAEWLRPIDAGEMTLILDACYSAESVQAGDFKPGPMGSRGLGQMAYDKRMRVLAASQSDAVAHEYDYLHQGLLSYVLVKDGLDRFLADWKPKNGEIKVGEWLSYAAAKVPEFKPATPAGENKGTTVEKSANGTKAVGQVPALFDFSRADTLVLAK